MKKIILTSLVSLAFATSVIAENVAVSGALALGFVIYRRRK